MESNRMARARSEGGFTLIEIMVVVVILGILAAVVVPAIIGRPDEAKVQAARLDIEGLTSALELYKLDAGSFPTTEQGLDALIRKPGSPPEPKKYAAGGYLKGNKSLLDPWGNPYYYLSPGKHNPQGFDLMSFGADGIEGGEGNGADVTNWDEPRS
jgi:general secretion pathway protein G